MPKRMRSCHGILELEPNLPRYAEDSSKKCRLHVLLGLRHPEAGLHSSTWDDYVQYIGSDYEWTTTTPQRQ
jgi:hypothetical protein